MVGDGETGLGMFGHMFFLNTFLYNIQRLLGRYRCFIDFFGGKEFTSLLPLFLETTL